MLIIVMRLIKFQKSFYILDLTLYVNHCDEINTLVEHSEISTIQNLDSVL